MPLKKKENPTHLTISLSERKYVEKGKQLIHFIYGFRSINTLTRRTPLLNPTDKNIKKTVLFPIGNDPFGDAVRST